MTFGARLGRVILPLVLITMVGVALAPLPSGISSPSDPDRLAFREFMEPRLRVLLEAAETVESMVQDRSRNVVALRAEASRIESLVNEIDEYLVNLEIADSMTGVIQQYHLGSELILTSVDGAWSALRSFDFSMLPELIPLFSQGTDHIENAIGMLVELEEAGSSYTESGDA